jgi:hypothetical protein
MFATNSPSLLLRLSAPVVALLSVGVGDSMAQSLGEAGTRIHEQGLTPPVEVFAFQSSQRLGAMPTMNVGVRYRLSEQHLVFANASGIHGASGTREPGADPFADDVRTKLGVEWKPAKSALGLERGAIGLQLDSGYRLSLRTKRGGAALYLRGKF